MDQVTYYLAKLVYSFGSASSVQALCQALVRVPRALVGTALAALSTVAALATLSFSLGSVVHNTDVVYYSLAKPATTGRVVRQTEVAHFGTKVSNAFGIEHHVAKEFADWILEASERQELAPELLASLVVTESSFRKSVRSNVGAVGPTQIRPDFWGEFCGDHELTDPELNVYCGAQVLSHMLERCDGDHDCALAAYNIGPYGDREDAARRYLNKIDRYLTSLEKQAL
ncbi:MAG: lytic transglycosylase domain-containing protein [Pseudomonadota bacterium]